MSSLQRALATAGQRLTAGSDEWPEGAVAVTFGSGGIDTRPRGRVAYVPAVGSVRQPPAALFARGEALEFRQRDLNGAIEAYRELARSRDPAIRAGALLRLARNLQNAGRAADALDAYARLAEIDDVWLDGVPAGLVARYSRCRLFAKQNRTEDLRSEAAELDTALQSGRWPLTAPVYWLYARDVAQWTGIAHSGSRPEEAFAAIVAALWDRWTASRGSNLASAGRESREVNGQQITVIWQNAGGTLRALIAARSFVESQWLLSLTPILQESEVSFGLRDAEGKPWLGTLNEAADDAATRTAADAGLPWSIVAASLSPPREVGEFAARRRLLIAGFVMLVLMALMASYAIVRAVSRELAVARLQSDFVAAVSHEFRTPLTSLRQFTEMLRGNRSLDEERRRLAYDAQARATDRLTRLVESLLDFGRMQAGVRRYSFEPRDCSELVRGIVEDFRSEAASSGHVIEFCGNGSIPREVDAEALSRAVRNLLDNAVKYSPEPQPIQVEVGRRDSDVIISVKDRGIGIPAAERMASRSARVSCARVCGRCYADRRPMKSRFAASATARSISRGRKCAAARCARISRPSSSRCCRRFFAIRVVSSHGNK